MTPAKSHAIVVGIENYGVQGLTLRGPVDDALKVVEWLGLVGMPRDHIHLFLAPEDPSTLPEGARPATFLEFELFREKLSNLNGDVLYLFWGGHGFLSNDRDRVLFWSDVSEAALDHHLNFTGFLGYLRDRSFAVQIGLVDACAESWERKRRLFDLGRSKWSSSVDVGKSEVRQSYIFAAAEGQTTSNAPGERLTPIYLDAVRSVFSQTQQWPPDPDEVFKRLCSRFANDPKRPARYEYRSLNGDTSEFLGRTGVVIPLTRLRAIAEEQKLSGRFLRDFVAEVLKICPAEDMLLQFHEAGCGGTTDEWIAQKARHYNAPELRLALNRLRLLSRTDNLLRGLGVEPEDYQECHSFTVRQLRGEPAEGTLSRHDILADLWDYGTNLDADADDNFALWLFLSGLLRKRNDDQLKAFVEQGAGERNVERIERLLNRADSEARAIQRHVLLISIDPAPGDRSRPDRLQAWLRGTVRATWNAKLSDWQTAKREVARIIREARVALRRAKRNTSDMTVELAVPTSFFDVDYESIEIQLDEEDVRTLAGLHAVYLRWGPRLFCSDDCDFDDEWWARVSREVKAAPSLRSKWFLADHSAKDYLSQSGLISLGFIPDSEATRRKRTELVRSGAPLVRWKRNPPVDSDKERSQLDELVQAMDGTKLDLLIGKLGRREGEALFWDDADHTLDRQFQLAEISTVK